MTFDIVLLAMVAAFLGLRLYSVLGKRTGHEQKPIAGPQDEASANENANSDVADIMQRAAAKIETQAIETEMMDPAAENSLRAIMAADRGFNLAQFSAGAKAAYEMTLASFWGGNREELQKLCDADVYADFEAVITAREQAGQIVENKLVRIEKVRIVEAEFDKPIARVTVRFDADIAALTRDKDGNVIGGSLSDAIETHDIWTFERDVKNSDRNWTLIATDAA